MWTEFSGSYETIGTESSIKIESARLPTGELNWTKVPGQLPTKQLSTGQLPTRQGQLGQLKSHICQPDICPNTRTNMTLYRTSCNTTRKPNLPGWYLDKSSFWCLEEHRLQNRRGHKGGMLGMHPPIRPKEVLIRNLISLKVIAKDIFALHIT